MKYSSVNKILERSVPAAKANKLSDIQIMWILIVFLENSLFNLKIYQN